MDSPADSTFQIDDSGFSAFTFWLNETLYALSVTNVLSITQDNEAVSPVPDSTKGLLGIVRYQGKPVTVFDFAARIGVESGTRTKQEMTEKLGRFERDMEEWVEGLEHAIQDDSPFQGARNANQTRFGEWLKRFESRDENVAELVELFAEPFEELFAIGNRALDARLQRQADEAKSLLSNELPRTATRMRSVFSQLRQLLTELARPVILYVTRDGKDVSFALRIDDVNNILSFTKDEFTPMASDSAVLGCLCKENEPDCLLVDIDALAADTVIATATISADQNDPEATLEATA